MPRPPRRPRGSSQSSTASTRNPALEWIAVTVVVVLAAVLLFWRLGAVYLWQDEANTAVLAVRMLKYGKPLAYDGVNLISTDNFATEDRATIGTRTTDPNASVDYIIGRGDLKADSSWIYQPWGQFLVTAASIRTFGQTTLAARLPFAMAAFASVCLLYGIERRATASVSIASLSCLLLLANAYWVLHGRQARYYALSTLLLLLTVLAYDRWQRGSRWGSALFVAAAWGWFQVDYGTVWPAVGVMFLHALIVKRRSPGPVLISGLALAAAVAPFVFFYQLFDRVSAQSGTWPDRLGENLFNLNRFVIPAVVLAAAIFILGWRWRRLADAERRLVVVSVGLLLALTVWVPTVAPMSFLRYVIMAAPIGCLVTAWALVRGLGARPALIGITAAVLAVTPCASIPFESLAPLPVTRPGGALVRPELTALRRNVFRTRRDPNQLVVEWLKQHAQPTDEILINYEDLPLMYYLPNPVRGGIAAFRVEDDAKTPPRFAIMRRSVSFVHWPVFRRELSRYQWDPVPLKAPDVLWGNNPDPYGQIQDPDSAPDLLIARRRN
jgi:hypothetical protein